MPQDPRARVIINGTPDNGFEPHKDPATERRNLGCLVPTFIICASWLIIIATCWAVAWMVTNWPT